MDTLSRVRTVSCALSLAILIMLSGTITNTLIRPAEAQQNLGADWKYVNYDKLATGFNPQTEITKDNIQFLEIKWILPVPIAPASVGGYAPRGQGVISTPLVIEGVMYVVSNYGDLISIDAGNGKVVWTYTPKLNKTEDEKVNPPIINLGSAGSIGGLGHVHGFNFIDGKLYIPTPPCDVHAVDRLGKLVMKIPYMCVNAPGNTGLYKGKQSYGPVAYEKGRVLIVPAGPVDETNNGARGFFAGYNMDTGQLMWRFFVAPPSGGDPEWALRECSKGWIQGIKCTDIPREILLNDWGQAGAKGGQGGPSWGQYSVDEDTGIAYVATSQPAPDFNATYRPGPNLYTNSVVALRAMTGEVVWWHQTTTHDLWDWDCSWNLILARIADKKIVYKGCKNGILHAFDAADGRVIWKFDPLTDIQKTRCVPNCYLLDPKSASDMKKPWQNYPSGDPFWMNPPGFGGIESDISLAYGKIYVAVHNAWSYQRVGPVEYIKGKPVPGLGGNIAIPNPEPRPTNTTVYAIDAATGKVVWSYFIPNIAYRGGIITSGGLVFLSTINGAMYAIDAENGKLVWQKFLGTPMIIPPTIAASPNGKMMLYQIIGGQGIPQFGSGTPGAIMAFGLPDKMPEVKEITKEVIKEVTKEVIKEVPREQIGTITFIAIGIAIVSVVSAGVVIARRRRIEK